MSNNVSKWVTGVSYTLLTIAAAIFFQAILDDLITPKWLTWLIPILTALGILGILMKSIIGASISPPLSPPVLTQEVFNYYADTFLQQFISRWKLLAWLLGLFTAFGLAFYGIDAHKLRKQLREGQVDVLMEKIQNAIQQTSKLPEILGQLSAAKETYDLATTSPQLQQHFGLEQLEIIEKQQEVTLIQKGLIHRMTRLASLNIYNKIRAETVSEYHKRITTYVSELLLRANSQDKFKEFHENMHDAVGHEKDFAEPFLAIIEILRHNTEIDHSPANRLKHIGDHLQQAKLALQTDFYEEGSEYKRFLLGKLYLELALYFIQSIQRCSDPVHDMTLCRQLADLAGLERSGFEKPELQTQMKNGIIQAAYDALNTAQHHFRALTTKGATAILTPRLYHVRTLIAYAVEDDIEKAREFAIQAIKRGRLIDVPVAPSLNALAWMYVETAKKKDQAGFQDKQFEAVRYAYAALQERLTYRFPWMDTLETYVLALDSLGFHYYAVIKEGCC